MSHLSQTLERLIEIISVEKLVGLIEKNTNESPIISPKSNISQSNITVKDYSDEIAKIQEQLVAINSSLLSLSEAIKNVVIGNNECKHVANPDAKVVEEEHIRLNIEEKVCCLPTVADTISEIVDNMNDKDISEAKEDISEAKEDISEAEEDISEAEEEEEVEDISEAEEEEEEVEEEEEEVEEEEVEEEEVGVESEEEEAKEEEAEEEDISKAEEEEAEEEEDVSEAKEEEEEAEVESEEEVGVDSEGEVKESEEEDEEVFEIEIDDVTYYATSEENGILYAVDKDGEVGKQVGIIKDGEPIFS
jgi:cobalamin biosynthesis protein CobT